MTNPVFILTFFLVDTIDIALASLCFVTTREKKLLKKNIDSLDCLALLSIEDISSIVGRPLRADWDGPYVKALAEKSLGIMESKGIKCSVIGEDYGNGGVFYPAILGTINDPPYAFFYRSDIQVLLKKKCVSVVGTRNVCQETARASLDFSREAASHGLTVVSGLANGTDAFAHRGALESGLHGTTAAVLPCGIESIVPYGNRGLASSILKEGGLLCSEYVPGTPAEPWRYVQRNRIIAALSGATVVVHAPKGSGALITADFAINYGRELMFHRAGLAANAKKNASDVSVKKATAERFIEDGAPVIESYADYVRVMENPPGTLSIKDRQLELF